MNMRKQKIVLLVIVVILSMAGYFLARPTVFGICQGAQFSCMKIVDGLIGTPIFYFSLAAIVPILIMVFLKDYIFRAWKKFAIIYIIISIALIAYMPTTAPGFNIVNKQLTTQALAILFFISSILLFIIVSLRNRNKSA